MFIIFFSILLTNVSVINGAVSIIILRLKMLLIK